MKKEKKRIPYEEWMNSQLSIARFFGGCKIDGKRYTLDYKNCRRRERERTRSIFRILVED